MPFLIFSSSCSAYRCAIHVCQILLFVVWLNASGHSDLFLSPFVIVPNFEKKLLVLNTMQGFVLKCFNSWFCLKERKVCCAFFFVACAFSKMVCSQQTEESKSFAQKEERLSAVCCGFRKPFHRVHGFFHGMQLAEGCLERNCILLFCMNKIFHTFGTVGRFIKSQLLLCTLVLKTKGYLPALDRSRRRLAKVKDNIESIPFCFLFKACGLCDVLCEWIEQRTELCFYAWQLFSNLWRTGTWAKSGKAVSCPYTDMIEIPRTTSLSYLLSFFAPLNLRLTKTQALQ